MTNAIERSTMRKIYLRLLPLAVVSYLLAYIDRHQRQLRRAEDARRSEYAG